MAPLSVPATSASTRRHVTCRHCETSRGIDLIAIPYVFRYLVTELLAMNVRLVLKVV